MSLDGVFVRAVHHDGLVELRLARERPGEPAPLVAARCVQVCALRRVVESQLPPRERLDCGMRGGDAVDHLRLFGEVLPVGRPHREHVAELLARQRVDGRRGRGRVLACGDGRIVQVPGRGLAPARPERGRDDLRGRRRLRLAVLNDRCLADRRREEPSRDQVDLSSSNS